MKTIEQYWRDLAANFIAGGMPVEQIAGMKVIFYSGALAMARCVEHQQKRLTSEATDFINSEQEGSLVKL